MQHTWQSRHPKYKKAYLLLKDFVKSEENVKINSFFQQGCEIEISRQVRILFKEFKEYREKELWADSYYCGTAGHVSQEQVIRYIAEQEKEVKDIRPFSYSIFDKRQKTLADFVG